VRTIGPMPPSTPVARTPDEARIRYTLHLHDRPVTSLQQAAEERGPQPGQIVRSLVFRLERDYILVLTPGPAQVSWPKLRRHLEVSRLTMASPDEVLRVTGYPPGAVSPFGLATAMRILADRRLLSEAQEHQGGTVAGARGAGAGGRRLPLA